MLVTKQLSALQLSRVSDTNKDLFKRLASIYIDYGLTVSSPGKSSDYLCIEPPIKKLVIFTNDQSQMRISMSVGSILQRALKVEFVNRLIKSRESDKSIQQKPKEISSNEANKKPVTPPKEIKVKDFFGRMVTKPAPVVVQKIQKPVQPVIFKYQEGFTNAVKRNVYIKDFL